MGTTGYKWAREILPGDVLRIRGVEYPVLDVSFTPVTKFVRVQFSDGTKARYHPGACVLFRKPALVLTDESGDLHVFESRYDENDNPREDW